MDRTDEAQLRELQDHPVLRRELQSKVLHGGKVVGLGHDVVLQLRGRETGKHVREMNSARNGVFLPASSTPTARRVQSSGSLRRVLGAGVSGASRLHMHDFHVNAAKLDFAREMRLAHG